ncbi:MAG: transketolase [Deltaproteobacteria bacterium]|nr:transketolase [Deltaproteobacteria bacterium]
MNESRDPRKSFGEALVEVAERDERVLAISTDSSGGSGLGPFKERFPERHIEFGIMEQGAIGFASGLATTGKFPFLVAISTFVTARPFEMVKIDLGYMRQNVKVVGRCSGLTYSTLGPTHYSLEDIALMRTIPGMTILVPGDPVEIRKAVYAASEHVGPLYMRIGSPPMPVLHGEDLPYEIGKGVLLRDGSDVAIVACGTVLSKAYSAAEILEKEGIKPRLIDMHTIKPIDKEIIVKAARETGKIVTVEEHYLTGGLGSAVAEVLVRQFPVPLKMIGVDDRFADTGPYEELLGLYGLQPRQIADTVREFVRGNAKNPQ